MMPPLLTPFSSTHPDKHWRMTGSLLSVCALLAASQCGWAAPRTVKAISLEGEPLYAQAAAFPYANPAAPKGGSFIRAGAGTFDSLNTLVDKGTPALGTDYLSDSLTTASLDEPFARYGLLAERMTYDPQDASWIEYHLNPKARFSNGQPVTADDVVFTFDTILRDGTPGLRAYFADIQSVKALNKTTVRFNFKTRTNRELLLIVGEVKILSRADWQGRSFNAVTLKPYLGSGPYLIERIEPGRAITYRRNPNYWAKDLPVNRGRYNFDRIRYVYYREPEVSFTAFKAGQYTFRAENKAKNWAKNYNFPAVQTGFVKREVIALQTPQVMQATIFNLRDRFFQDRRVREALILAYDFEWMNKALFIGQYQRLNSFFQGSELAASGRPSAAEMAILQPLLPQLSIQTQRIIFNHEQLPVSDGRGFNRTNLLKARALLLQAGYRYQNGKLVDAQGKPIVLEYLIADNTLQRIVLPYAQNLARLGIELKIRVIDAPQYIERIRRFDFDLITDHFPQSLSPGNEQLGYWSSQAAREPGSQNTAGIQSPVIDRIVQGLLHAPNRQSLITHTRALDRVLQAERYMIPQYTATGERVAYWRQLRHPARLPRYDLGLDFWWIDQADEQRVSEYLRGNRKP